MNQNPCSGSVKSCSYSTRTQHW